MRYVIKFLCVLVFSTSSLSAGSMETEDFPDLPYSLGDPLLRSSSLYSEVLELLNVREGGFVAFQIGEMRASEAENFLRQRREKLDRQSKLSPESLKHFDLILMDLKILQEESQENQ